MNFKLRSDASHGLWCSLLLPCSLFFGVFRHVGSSAYTVACALSFGLLGMTLLRKKIYVKTTSTLQSLHIPCFLISILIATVLCKYTSYNMFHLFLISYASILLFDWVYSTLLVKCPGSFTLGEASMVAQGTTLFITSCFLSIHHEQNRTSGEIYTEAVLESTKFLQVLLLGCFALILVLNLFPCLHSTCSFYLACSLTGGLAYVTWNLHMGKDPVVWLIAVSFQSLERAFLMLFWIVSTAASISFVVWQNRKTVKKASTSSRKYFHVIIILVFLPGVLVDPELLYLASAVALSVFLLLEILRVLKIPPVGPSIESAFQVFLDEKDSGALILTHIYLLIGCACPLWLYSSNFDAKGSHISLLSGVISVGLGDTAAAVGGSILGKHRWKGTKKTVEGTVCAMLVQLICTIPLLLYSHEVSAKNILITLVAIFTTSILEAKTTQVDNLVLPLFMFSFLSLID